MRIERAGRLLGANPRSFTQFRRSFTLAQVSARGDANDWNEEVVLILVAIIGWASTTLRWNGAKSRPESQRMINKVLYGKTA